MRNVLLLVLLASTTALAQAGEVTAIAPLRPIQVGDSTIDLGVHTSGDVATVQLALEGTGGGATLVQLAGVTLKPDTSGVAPFRFLAPLAAAFTSDGSLKVTATPVSAAGAQGTPFIVTWSQSASTVSITRAPALSAANRAVSLQVQTRGALARAEATILGVNAGSLRAANGNVKEVRGGAFVTSTKLVGQLSPTGVSWTLPAVADIPFDGVVIADVMLEDVFGRRMHKSLVEFTGDALDTLLDLSIQPSSVLLRGGLGSRVRIGLTANFSLAGPVPVSAPTAGLELRCRDEAVCAVTEIGEVVARGNGTTTLDVTYAGEHREVPVVVDSNAQVTALSLVPASLDLSRVGATGRLIATATLSTGTTVDVSPAVLGSVWTSDDVSVATVSPDGLVTGVRPGSARIRAATSGYVASSTVVVHDGLPSVSLQAPSTVRAGTTFDVSATATDDIGIARVEFLVNGVPAGSDSTAPYTFTIRAPTTSGGTILVSARAVDSGAQSSTSPAASVVVLSGTQASALTPVWEVPQPGVTLPVGVPTTVRVTSGTWTACPFSLSNLDFQAVRFTADDGDIGSATVARLEVRQHPSCTPGSTATFPVLVPLWEVSWSPPSNRAGTSAIIRAEARDRVGLTTSPIPVAVSLAADAPPAVSISRPAPPTATATAGLPLVVSGFAGDDAAALGLDVMLLADGAAVGRTTILAQVAGSNGGGGTFNFTWTPPSGRVGSVVQLEVVATDSRGQTTRASLSVTVVSDTPPQVTILSPATQSTVTAGSSTPLTATALDDSGSVAEVTWFIDGAPVGRSTQPPFTTTWRVPTQLAGRSARVRAEARDGAGQVGSAEISVSVIGDTQRPTASIVSPAANSSVANSQDVTVGVGAFDDIGIARIEFLVDGLVVATDTSPSPVAGQAGAVMAHTVVPRAQLQGATTRRLGARAYDVAGNVGVAAEATITITDDAPPQVSFVTPAAAAEVTAGTTATVLATATDDVAIVQVELRVDGVSTGVRAVPPFQFDVRLNGPPRQVQFELRARDSSGATATATRTIAVVADSEPPLVAFRTPLPGSQTFAGSNLKVEVLGTDNVLAERATLSVNGQTALTNSSPTIDGLYRVFTFTIPVPAAGQGTTLSLLATVFDSAGLSATRTQTVRVVVDSPPRVQLLAPAAQSTYREGREVQVVAVVQDDDGVVGVAGRSGGNQVGTLATGPVRLDVTQRQNVTVRAPIITRGQAPTVGMVARDSSGQTGFSDVALLVLPDTESPSAVMTLPIPAGIDRVVSVDEGESVAVRLETSDDVFIEQALVMLDAGVGDGGVLALTTNDGRLETTQTQNPALPGAIITDERYVATFQGSVRSDRLGPGRYPVALRVSDPAGNVTSPVGFVLEVRPFVDRLAPQVNLSLTGTPSANTCVEGSSVRLNVSATDDGSLANLEVKREGVVLPLPPTTIVSGRAVQVAFNVTIPTLGADQDGFATFTTRAVDATGKEVTVVTSCQIVANEAPSVAFVQPTSGATLTEGKREGVVVSLLEDVAVRQLVLGLGSAPLEASDGGVVLRGLASSVPVSLDIEGQFRAQLNGSSLSMLGGGSAQQRLINVTVPAGTSIVSRFNFEAATADGGTSFQGTRTFTSTGAPVAIGWPTEITVRDVQLEIGSLRLTIEPASTQPQLTLEQGTARFAVVAIAPNVQPGRETSAGASVRSPVGWRGTAQLSAVACDETSACGSATRAVGLLGDTTQPFASISSPRTGEVVVTGRSLQVSVNANDNVEVRAVELLVDGVVVGRNTGFSMTQSAFSLTAPASRAAPLSLVARTVDGAGNARESAPVFVSVVDDVGPTLTLDGLRNAFESISNAELSSGFVSLLQGTPATLDVSASDDVGVSRLVVEFDGQTLLDRTFTNPGTQRASVVFTPPAMAPGAAKVLVARAADTAGREVTRRLIVESRSPRAPAVSLILPTPNSPVLEGSIQLVFEAIAGDDIGMNHVDFFLNGQPAAQVSSVVSTGITVTALDESGNPIIQDPIIRDALALLPAPFNDPSNMKRYRSQVAVPTGLIQRGANNSITVRAVATDREGLQSSVERVYTIVPDTTPPVPSLARPVASLDVIESTIVTVEANAFDDVFVETIEVSAGPTLQSLQVVHVASGFPAVNAAPGSSFGVFAPTQTLEVPVPRLAQLGATATTPYFIAVRARDASGTWSQLLVRDIDIVPDTDPTVAISSPIDGSPVVQGNFVDVSVLATDDVAVSSVSLLVDGNVFPIVRQLPPFTFRVPVPSQATELRVQARGVDTFGHEVLSQLVRLPARVDAPPTVAVTRPAAGATLTEGRYATVIVAAADDVSIARIDAEVTGLASGTLNTTSASSPLTFDVPLPFGTAGRQLTVNAWAVDSSGKRTAAAPLTFSVVADTQAPTISFRSPSAASQIVAGQPLPVDLLVDDNIDVASVSVTANGLSLGTLALPPFRFSTLVPSSAAGQTYALVATARDSSGNEATASRTVDIVGDTAPTVTLTAAAQVVAGAALNLNASATDDVGVARVEFLVGPSSSALVPVGTRYVLPYQQPYNAPPTAIGQTLFARARAYDVTGKMGESAIVSFQVTADSPPTVALSRPVPGTFVFEGRPLVIEADALDAQGAVAQVVFLVDGRRTDVATVPAGVPGFPNRYRGRWVPPIGSGNKTFLITAVAVDNAGQEATSAAVAVGSVTDTVPPDVQMVDPAPWDVVTEGRTVSIRAAAADNAAVASVEAFVNGASVGTTGTPSSSVSNRTLYSVSWLVPNGAGQERRLSAQARDVAGNVATSANPTDVEIGLRPSSTLDVVTNNSSVSALATRADGLTATVARNGELRLSRRVSGALSSAGGLDLGAEGRALAFTEALAGTPSSIANLLLVATAPVSTNAFPQLVVVDVSSPGLPSIVGRIDLPVGAPSGIASAGRLAFVAVGAPGIVAIDLSVPSSPQRVLTRPLVAAARDVAVVGEALLVAADTGGLRVMDVRSPSLAELSFVALPGRSMSIAASAGVAVVGCEAPDAPVAFVDITTLAAPVLRSLTPQRGRRPDVLMTEAVDVALAGQVVVSAGRLRDQDGVELKDQLTANATMASGALRPFVRANLREQQGGDFFAGASLAAFGGGVPVAMARDRVLASFALPVLSVTGVSPSALSQSVPLDVAFTVTFNLPPDGTSVPSPVTLRVQDPLVGPVVPATVTTTGSTIVVTPLVALPPSTVVHLSVDGALKSTSNVGLIEPYRTSFRTAGSAGLPPVLSTLTPAQGPLEGGTTVTLTGTGFTLGARVFFGSFEASVTSSSPTGITVITPANVEGPSYVAVVNTDGQSSGVVGGFLYVPVLDISFVQPASGPIAGGSTVQVVGTGFQRGAIVKFDGVAATQVVVSSSGRLSAVTPAGVFGPADVEVVNPDGKTVRLEAAYLYTDVSVTGRLSRYEPLQDGPVRPIGKLGASQVVSVTESNGRVAVLQAASIAQGATSVGDLIASSQLGAVSLVELDGGVPAVVGGASFLPPYAPVGVAMRGATAWVSLDGKSVAGLEVAGEGGPSLAVVDMTNPTSPSVGLTIPFAGEAGPVVAIEDLLVVASGSAGLTFFSIANPTRPILIGAVKPIGSNGQPVSEPRRLAPRHRERHLQRADELQLDHLLRRRRGHARRELHRL